MKFGIFIRSVGERTEKLCIEACKQSLDSSKIHLIKNYYPAHKAYAKMFRMADELGYDWYLGLDADVILKGTRVDGIYTEDPEKNPEATK